MVRLNRSRQINPQVLRYTLRQVAQVNRFLTSAFIKFQIWESPCLYSRR